MTKTISKSDIVVEVFNAITHGIAALLGVVAMIFLMDKALSHPEYVISEVVAYTIYGTSLIILFYLQLCTTVLVFEL